MCPRSSCCASSLAGWAWTRATSPPAPPAWTRIDGLVEADVALRLDQLELAEHLYTQTLEASTDRAIRGRALGGLGEIDLHAGRLDDGDRAAGGEPPAARRRRGRHPGIVDALARAYGLESEFEKAIGLLEHSLRLARDRGDYLAEARFAILLANVLIDSGNLASARELLGHSLARSEESTDPILQARLYWSQSRLHSAEANCGGGLRYARMALAAIELTENVSYAARAHQLLAHVELERGNAEEALDLIDRGQELAVRAGGADADGYFKIVRRAGARAARAGGGGDRRRDGAGRRLRRAAPTWPAARTRSRPTSMRRPAIAPGRSSCTSSPPS